MTDQLSTKTKLTSDALSKLPKKEHEVLKTERRTVKTTKTVITETKGRETETELVSPRSQESGDLAIEQVDECLGSQSDLDDDEIEARLQEVLNGEDDEAQ